MTRIRVSRRVSAVTAVLLTALSAAAFSQGGWSAKAPMPTPRYAHRGVELNGFIHVVGGVHTAVTCTFDATHYVYDPVADSWSTRASMNTARVNHGGAVLNDGVKDLLYVVGGSTGCGPRTQTMEAYDPDTNTWQPKAPMPGGPRSTMGVAVVNGILYVVGGQYADSGINSGMTTLVEAYDPLTDTWTTKAPLPGVRYTMAIGAIDGILYVAGGGDPSGPLDSVLAFDPVANVWTQRTPMPARRSGAGSTVANGRLYVVGGYTPPGFVGTLNIYDPVTDSWSTGPSLPAIRTELIAVSVNGRVHAIGGLDGTNPAIETYALDSVAPTTTATYPAPNANGWNRFNVPVTLNAMSNPGGGAVQSIVYSLSGAQSGGGTIQNNFASFTIFNEGITTVTYHAVDMLGNRESDRTFTVKLDKTAPVVANLSNISTNATSSSGATVFFNVAASDPMSGIATQVVAPLASGATFPHGSTNETVTVADAAGNTTSRFFSVTVNRALVSISVTPSPATMNIGQGQQFTATGLFTDQSTAILPSMGSGGGGGGPVASAATWHIHFSMLNVGACAPGLSFSSQGIFVAQDGTVDTRWNNSGSPVVNVTGTVTSQQVNLALACTSTNGTGSLVANWTGTRYEGTATLSGVTVPVTLTGWSPKTAMPTARFALGAATVNGIVYAIGGATSNAVLNAVEAYDPVSETWTAREPMPTAREGAGVAALGGLIYVAGGRSAGGAASGLLEAYDPISNTWNSQPLASMTPRAHLALVAAGGMLYAIGGDTGLANSGVTPLVERYSPATNQWTTMAPMATPRNFLVAGALDSDSLIVVAGGSGSSTEIYNVASNSWSAGPAMLNQASGMAAAVVNNAMFVVGASTNGGLRLAHMFRPASNQQPAGWAALGLMPTARGELAAAAVGDVVYAIGGRASGQTLMPARVEALSTPPPFDLFVSSGGGGGGFSLPTVSWQSTDASIVGISSSGFASAQADGQATIIATAGGLSCVATGTCATVTVVDPNPECAEVTFNITGANVPFGTIQAEVENDERGPFEIALGVNRFEVTADTHTVHFMVPEGFKVTPNVLTFTVGCGDSVEFDVHVEPIDTAPPVLMLPGNQTAEATSAAGAMVTFPAATATDLGTGVQSVTCNRQSGEVFPLGPTTVTCTATDNADNSASGSFTITVVDTTAPAVTTPANLVVNQTNVGGAVVAFSASATDTVDGTVPVSCVPASGSLFPVGTTTVRCSASDAHLNSGEASFTVTVLSTTQIVSGLLDDIDSFQQGRSLLENVLKSLDRNNISAACGQLTAFISMVQAQTGKNLTESEAALLVQAAADARLGLGCQ